MIHYTLNTGHSRESPRSEVRMAHDELRGHLGALLEPGDHALSWYPGWRLVVPQQVAGGFLATLYLREAPVVTLGFARDEPGAEAVWGALESLYLRLTDQPPLAGVDFQAPRRPESLPWVSVVIVGQSIESWIGDFERCLAWTWLESIS